MPDHTPSKKSESASVSEWQRLAAAKRADLRATIPKDLLLSHPFEPPAPGSPGVDVRPYPTNSRLLTQSELAITEVCSVQELLDSVASGAWKAEDVAKAFIRRATVAQQVVHPLTETMFERAMARAKELDEHLARTGKVVGPLQYVGDRCSGLPISLKDQVPINGVEHTMCWVGRVGEFADKDALIAQLLEKQGAILYCKTNMPQASRLCVKAPFNNLYGCTLNPYKASRTSLMQHATFIITGIYPGGSSTGEAALIAMRGSIVGMGSDNGGSLRVPAAYNGIYSLKPSRGRLPYADMPDPTPFIKIVMGPMSATVDGLRIITKAVIDTEPWLADPDCMRIPWSENAYQLRDHGRDGVNGEVASGKVPEIPKLAFGIMWDDGHVLPDPPYKRALTIVRMALLDAGHEVHNFEAYRAKESHDLGIYNVSGDQGVAQEAARSGEPILVFPPAFDPSLPFPELRANEIAELGARRNVLCRGALDEWNTTASKTSTGRPLDAIIAPPAAAAPYVVGKRFYQGYSEYCNMHDYSTSVFPVTMVDQVQDVQGEREEFLSDWDRFTYENYDPVMSHGTPIGLQCIGRKYEEEAVIRITEIVASYLASSVCA